MKPWSSLLVSLLVVGGTFAAAWLVFFPTYDTNDDVAIRLLLEGRLAPGATPSAFAYFVNLALGQVLAGLYRISPALSWYDIAEQGTLLLSAAVALYCCARCTRHVEDAAFLLLLAVLFLSVFAVIQFTAVAYLGMAAGLCAVALETAGASRRERTGLATVGVALVAVAGLFRIEAGLLAVVFFLVVFVTRQIAMRMERGTFAVSRTAVVGLLASLTVFGLSWTYHFATYLSMDSWSRFSTWNLLRARLSEYGLGRSPAAAANPELAATGWTSLDSEMLRNWLLIDPEMFSMARLSAVAAKLPVVSHIAFADIAGQLASYATAYPALLVGILGVACGVSRIRDLGWMVVSFLGLIGIVVAISFVLKPLEQRLVWPIGVAFILTVWLFSRVRPGEVARPRRLAAAAILLLACVPALERVVAESSVREREHIQAMAEVPSFMQGARVAVLVGGHFPFEFIERPFGAPLIQRAFGALPVGTTLWAPPFADFLAHTALPDLASWLCTDRNVIVMVPSSIEILKRYYAERRNQRAELSKVYEGKSIQSYQCRLAPVGAGE